MYIPPQILKSYQFGFVNSVNTSNINLVYNTFIPERLFAINFIKVVKLLWSPPNFIFPFFCCDCTGALFLFYKHPFFNGCTAMNLVSHHTLIPCFPFSHLFNFLSYINLIYNFLASALLVVWLILLSKQHSLCTLGWYASTYNKYDISQLVEIWWV